METYIEVSNEAAAKAICQYYGTTMEQHDNIFYVKVTARLECDICNDEEHFDQALRDIEHATGVSIDANDISF